MCSTSEEDGFAPPLEDGDERRQAEVLRPLIEAQSEQSAALLPWWVRELAAGRRLQRTAVAVSRM